MDNMIRFMKFDVDISYPISKIDCVSLNMERATVDLGLTGNEDTMSIEFGCGDEANAFYRECLDKIEAYYEAMKPPKLPENIKNLDISIDNFNYVNRLLKKAGD